MARYNGLTQRQREEIDAIEREKAYYKQQYERMERNLAKKIMTAGFEENKRLRKLAQDNKRKYESLQNEIESILNAYDEYEQCKSKADSLLTRAESLKETWGFK